MKITLKIPTKRGVWQISPLRIHQTTDGRVWTADYAGYAGLFSYEALFYNKEKRHLGLFGGQKIENRAIPTWIRQKVWSWMRQLVQRKHT